MTAPNGATGRNRTLNLRDRSPLLYPIELRLHILKWTLLESNQYYLENRRHYSIKPLRKKKPYDVTIVHAESPDQPMFLLAEDGGLEPPLRFSHTLSLANWGINRLCQSSYSLVANGGFEPPTFAVFSF